LSGVVFSKFYWSDWLSDVGLRTTSPAARALWMDMLCVMATCERPGYLFVNGSEMTTEALAALSHMPEEEVKKCLAELERNGVFSRDRHGKIISRRIIRDEKQRKDAKKNGKLGGNPRLGNKKGKSPPVNPSPNPPDNGQHKTHKPVANSHKPIASSSSSYDWKELELKLRKAAGWEREPAPSLSIVGPIVQLLETGASLEADVLPTIADRAPRVRVRTSWNYFLEPIREAWQRRMSSGIPTPPPASSIDRPTWERIAAAVEYPQNWSSVEWGPAPGEDGCHMPADLQRTVLAKWRRAA
jgi:hypothetical protein